MSNMMTAISKSCRIHTSQRETAAGCKRFYVRQNRISRTSGYAEPRLWVVGCDVCLRYRRGSDSSLPHEQVVTSFQSCPFGQGFFYFYREVKITR